MGRTALFLAGHAFFEWAVFGELPWSHVITLAVLAALIPVGFAVPTLALSGAASLVVISLATWETMTNQARLDSPRRSTT